MARTTVIRETAKVGRRLRSPSYQFQLETRPWQIQPFMAAPVLPGETMKNARFMSRVVSDPVKNPLVGWHKEYYFFYVKLRDMVGSADFEEMMLDPSKNMNSFRSGADVKFFHSYGINWAKRAYETVVAAYFRADDEPLTEQIDGLYVVSNKTESILDSAVKSSLYAGFNDVDVDMNADGTITVGEIEKAQTVYDLARQLGITDMDFNDYLRTFGVRLPQAEDNKPELIRMVREWTYPTNTIDPTSGAPSSALSWSIADRADKDRFFKEPGFILGCTVARPKVYLSNYKGSANGLLDNAFSWLPALLRQDVDSSWVHVPTATKANGPLDAQTEGYWFDMGDLFMYGEQFVNFAMNSQNKSMVALPTAGLQKRYPTAAMADALYVAPASNKVREDGRLDLAIASSLVDQSPSISRQMV